MRIVFPIAIVAIAARVGPLEAVSLSLNNPAEYERIVSEAHIGIAGFGGAFFAARQGIVNPESFTFIESALILSIVVLGGMGSQLGVVLAAVAVTILPELAREFSDYRMLVFGAAMVLMMVWRPQGLMPMRRMHIELKGQE